MIIILHTKKHYKGNIFNFQLYVFVIRVVCDDQSYSIFHLICHLSPHTETFEIHTYLYV